MTTEWSTLNVVVLGTVMASLLFGAALGWRRMLNAASSLPVWRFMRRAGRTRRDAEATTNAKAVWEAELRCMLCAGRPQCVRRIAIGDGSEPPEHCPNARFLEKLGLPGRGNHPTDARRGRE